jgi:hypothetical protein
MRMVCATAGSAMLNTANAAATFIFQDICSSPI